MTPPTESQVCLTGDLRRGFFAGFQNLIGGTKQVLTCHNIKNLFSTFIADLSTVREVNCLS